MAKRQRRRRQERRQEHARREGWKTRHSVITGVAVGATSMLGFAQGASATNFVVNNSGDAGNNVCEDVSAGDCTLRDAVYAANYAAGVDSVTFASSITGVTLTSGIIIVDGVNINGNGAGATTISGNNSTSLFGIFTKYDLNNVNFNDVTLSNGDATDTGYGGAILDIYSNLNIYDSVLSGNHAGTGGAIYEYGGYAGGTYTDIYRTTFSGNTAETDGGAIFAHFSAGQLIESTISGNGALNAGGGLYAYQTTFVNDDTFAGNSASFGGGVYAYFLNTMYAFNSIFAGNSGSPGFAPDFSGSVYGAANLVQDTTFFDDTQASGLPPNVTGQNPQLGALQNNGGLTPTRLLAPTSPAVDQGFSYLGTDQRGVGRPIDISTVPNALNGDGSDIGAVELTAAEFSPPGSPPPPVTTTTTKKKKKCKKKKKKHSSAQVSKKKKCKKKKKTSAALQATQSGGKDWPGQAFKVQRP